MGYSRWTLVLLLAVAALSAQAATTNYFIYDESGHVIGEYDANGNAVQEHVYLGDRPIAVVQGGASGTVGYVSTDQLNTPRVVTDQNQAVLWSWNSDPFGNGNPTGSLTYNLRFPGQYYDAETGHNYNYFRDYDSARGRFVESDPIGLRGGVNTYTYVTDNPTAKVDPAGLDGAVVPTPLGPPPYAPGGSPGWSAGAASWIQNHFSPSGAAAGLQNIESTLADWAMHNDQPCDREKQCNYQYEGVDVPVCRAIAKSRGSAAGARCYSAAAQRLAACLRGQPLPPLDTYNN